jgi:hypothetical protein
LSERVNPYASTSDRAATAAAATAADEDDEDAGVGVCPVAAIMM